MIRDEPKTANEQWKDHFEYIGLSPDRSEIGAIFHYQCNSDLPR